MGDKNFNYVRLCNNCALIDPSKPVLCWKPLSVRWSKKTKSRQCRFISLAMSGSHRVTAATQTRFQSTATLNKAEIRYSTLSSEISLRRMQFHLQLYSSLPKDSRLLVVPQDRCAPVLVLRKTSGACPEKAS